MDAHAAAHAALDWLAQKPPWISLAVCGGVATVEYVIPPIPHDVVVVAGGILAAHGVINPMVLLAVVTAGSTLGALAAWWIGKLAATRPTWMKFVHRFVKPASLEKSAMLFSRWGRLLIAANRFLPGVRTTLLFGAGMFGMSAVDVAVFGAVSAFLWNGLLIGAGVLLGAKLDETISLIETYSVVAWIILGLVVLTLVVRALMHRRKRVGVRA